MKRFSFTLQLLLLLLLIQSCEYPLNDEYSRTVEQVDPESLSIRLSPVDSVYYLTGLTHFSCKALTEGLILYDVHVFIDTTEITTYTNDDNSRFYLDCKDYQDGEYSLNLVVTTNTTSNSLADMLGAEGFIHSGSWKLIVDKSPPTPVQMTGIFNDNGILKIEWEKYSKKNFGCYKVVKTVITEYGTAVTNVVEVVSDSNRTYFYDSTFAGGWAEYVVRVETPIFKAASSEKKVYSDEYPEIKADWKYDNLVEVSWNKCKYPKAFVKYALVINHQETIEIDDINTTSLSGNYGILSHESSFRLSVKSRNARVDNGSVYNLISNTTSIVGEEFTAFSSAMKNQVNGYIFFVDATKLYSYNPLSGRIETIMLHPTTYPDYVLSPNFDKLFFGSNTKYINPTTFMINTVPPFNYLISNLSLTNYGIGNVSGSLRMYDYNNFVHGINLNINSYSDLSISENDKYIFDFDKYGYVLDCYEISNGLISKIWTIPAKQYMLIPGEPEKIIVSNSTSVEIRSVGNNQVLLSLPAGTHFLNDVYSPQKLFLIYDYVNDNLEFYNYETGEKLKSIYGESANYCYSGNTLFSSLGYKIPINW